MAVVLDEAAVKVNEAQQSLELIYRCGFRPNCHCPDLFWICPYLPTLSNVSQETYEMNIYIFRPS